MQISNHFHARPALPSKISLKGGWASELHRMLWSKAQRTCSRTLPNALEERAADGLQNPLNALEERTADVLQNYTERSGGKDSGRAPELYRTLWRKGQRTCSRTTLNALEERTADGLQNYTERSGGKESGRTPELH